MIRLLDLTLWKPISFDGNGSVNYFSEPQCMIWVDGAMIRIEGVEDVALVPWGDSVARATPRQKDRFAGAEMDRISVATREVSPFVKAAEILTPTIDQKMASQKVKK